MENVNQQEFCPDDNFVWAILSTFLCCFPLGIVAIVKSMQVEKLWLQGRKEEARRAALSAKYYAKWSALIFFGVVFIYFIFLAKVAHNL